MAHHLRRDAISLTTVSGFLSVCLLCGACQGNGQAEKNAGTPSKTSSPKPVATEEPDSSGGITSGSSLTGTWATKCVDRNTSTGSTTHTISSTTFSGNQGVNTLTYYKNAGCTEPLLRAVVTYTFKIGSQIPGRSGVFEFDMHTVSVQETALDAQFVTNVNASRSLCGFGDWVVNVPRDALKCFTDAQGGSADVYDVYQPVKDASGESIRLGS